MNTTIYTTRIQSPTSPGETTTPRELITQAQASAQRAAACHFEIYEMRAIEQLCGWLARLDDEREKRILFIAAKRAGWDLSPANVAEVTQAYDEAMSEILHSQV